MKRILGVYVEGKLWKKFVLDDFEGFSEGEEITLGRREDNDICIPQTAVSRKHAVIKRSGSSVYMLDCGSLNRMKVGGKTYEKIKLQNGMKIVIGSSPADSHSVVLMYVDGSTSAQHGSGGKKDVYSAKSSPFGRLIAFIVDMIICMFMCIGCLGIAVWAAGVRNKIALVAAAVCAFLSVWMYFALAESSGVGGTAGKVMTGVRVIKKDGSRAGLGIAALRQPAKILSLITLFLPVFGKGRCLHDLIVGTRVVKSR